MWAAAGSLCARITDIRCRIGGLITFRGVQLSTCCPHAVPVFSWVPLFAPWCGAMLSDLLCLVMLSSRAPCDVLCAAVPYLCICCIMYHQVLRCTFFCAALLAGLPCLAMWSSSTPWRAWAARTCLATTCSSSAWWRWRETQWRCGGQLVAAGSVVRDMQTHQQGGVIYTVRLYVQPQVLRSDLLLTMLSIGNCRSPAHLFIFCFLCRAAAAGA
jgi:hypothetical protein